MLGCQRLLVGAHQGKSAALQDAGSAKEVEEELLDRVNATDFIAMDPAEEHDPRPVHIAGNPHDAHEWMDLFSMIIDQLAAPTAFATSCGDISC